MTAAIASSGRRARLHLSLAIPLLAVPILAVSLLVIAAPAAIAVAATPPSSPSSSAGMPMAAGRDPNIVLINLDDASIDELDDWALQAWLPNLWALRSEGTRFRNLHSVAPLCGPSRGALFRGQYSHNSGVIYNSEGWKQFYDRGHTDSEIGMWMRDAGYATSLVGKYCHERYPGTSKNAAYVPPGWDEFHASLGGNYFNVARNVNGVRSVTGSYPNEYRTDVEADSIVSIIQNREPTNPLFLYFAPFGPHATAHGAGQSPDRYVDWGTTISMPITPDFNEADMSDKPAQFRRLPLLNDVEIASTRETYRDRIRSMRAIDDAVGRMVATLKAEGIYDETYIFLTSDNGFQLGHHRNFAKRDHYDRVTRVQLIVKGPGVAAGKEYNHLLASIDLIPTILELGGGTVPHFLDGTSFVPLLTDDGAASVPASSWQERILIEMDERKLVDNVPIDARWKMVRYFDSAYVEYHNGDRIWYDLANDPWQLTNTYSSLSTAQVSQHEAALDALRSCAGPACQGGAAVDPVATTFNVGASGEHSYVSVDAGNPMTLTGTATDDGGLAAVEVVVREVTTGHYWQGDAWSENYAASRVQASGRSHDWSMTVPFEHRKTYWASARAIDAAGNEGVTAATGFYSSPDRVAPKTTLRAPLTGSRLAGTLTLKGLSYDANNETIWFVLRNLDTGEYWVEGTERVAYGRNAPTEERTVAANLWAELDVDLPAGRYYAAVRSVDAAGNANTPSASTFAVLDAADREPPTATIENPQAATNSDEFVATGSIEEDNLDRVEIVVRNRATKKYWDGYGWVSDYKRVAAAYEQIGPRRFTWTRRMALRPGSYYLAVRAFDRAGTANLAPPWSALRVVPE